MIDLSSREFVLLSSMIENNTGIELNDDKKYLIEYRLSPLLKRFELSSYSDLYAQCTNDSSIRQEMVNAICTNETLFFRDAHPFKALTDTIIPKLTSSNPARNIKVLSAACSSGQEAISICIALADKGFPLGSLSILGVDISKEVVERARKAEYTDFEIGRGLKNQHINTYMQNVDGKYKPSPEISKCIEYKQANLLEPGSIGGKFDIIFCRNVACYFNVETKRRLFTNLAQLLTPDGYIIIGATENLDFMDSLFNQQTTDGCRYFQLSNP